MANSIGYTAKLALLAAVLVAVPCSAQQQNTVAPDDADQPSVQGAQPLDIQEAVAGDVLEPLKTGIESRNLKQVLAVFDPESVPNFPELRDHIKALLEGYAAFQFRYKILQVNSEDHHASMTCEFDLDATPADGGQLPSRRSTQMRLQLTQTPKGWRISTFAPGDFFGQ